MKYPQLCSFWSLGLLFLIFLGCKSEGEEKSYVTGLLDATEIDVASKIPGRVKDLFVREGDEIEAGQKLLSIESEEIVAKVDQVEAAVEAATANLNLARKGARKEEKRAVSEQLQAAKQQVDITKKMYTRLSDLLKKGAASQAQFDEAEFKFNLARGQLAQAQAKFKIVNKGAREEEIQALEAMVRKGKGTLAEIESYQKEMIQNAPIAGEITKIVLHRGELAATGYPILTIVDLSDIWAVFPVREDRLKHIKKGSKFKAKVPALGEDIEFEVFNIAALGDFATWRATGQKDSFDLKSFEVKARPTNPAKTLRPGMTVRWEI